MNESRPNHESSRSQVLSKAVANVAHHLNLSSVQLGVIIGISQPSASRLMNSAYSLRENAKEWEMAALLVRLYRGLYSIVGSNDQLAKDWLMSENSSFGNQSPLTIIQTTAGLVHACDYVDAHRAAT